MARRIVSGYEPDCMFGYFEEISAIPRGSGNECGMADYLVRFAEARGLYHIRDAADNVFMRRAPSPGREGDPPMLLQGHTDMVCAKNADSEHDFMADPLELFIEDGMLKARGTTLGADNGIAVAAMLELLNGGYSLPTLECLFTTEEETGMNGAFSFDCGFVTARSLINLDSEKEGVATAGCAGGVRLKITLPCERVSSECKAIELKLSGLHGGHSGAEIDKYRATP